MPSIQHHALNDDMIAMKMKSIQPPRPPPLALMAWLLVCIAVCTSRAAAFETSRVTSRHAIIKRHYRQYRHTAMPTSRLKSTSSPDDPTGDDGSDSDGGRGDASRNVVPNDMDIEIVRGIDSEISDGTWDDIEGGAPSRWMVMKNLLGINIFTYVLGAFIIFFLSMNAAFGPGWLGQSLGWEDVGTFTKVSDSLPLSVDVSRPDYLL